MKYLTNLPYKTLVVVLLFFLACKQKGSSEKDTTVAKEKPSISIEKLSDSPAYAKAVLRLEAPQNTENIAANTVAFEFEVQNYELGAQTISPNAQKLANSGKGQHIHFILNNQPYSAHYEADFSKAIPNGVHHLVAFLSRSYHESVKNENSVVVKKIVVGENAKDTIGINITDPTLIYSRPKGTYAGKDTENLLLDFFVLNTTLSEKGNSVKATINGQEFILTEWAPYIIKGLPLGEVTIQLALQDKNGNTIPGPFNTVTRKVMLTE